MLNTALRRTRILLAGIVIIWSNPAATMAPIVPQADALTVVSAGPSGEVESLSQANEIRVVFSEPMVALGRIPAPVAAPFFSISPPVGGTFRWSGTTILIFTPDPKPGLPFSTKFDVTIDAGVQGVSGRRLARPYAFSFVTPTVKLLRPTWYRRNGTVDQPIVVALRFNQPVTDNAVLAHVRARFLSHVFDAPTLSADLRMRLKILDPQAIDRFEAKVAAIRAAASAGGPVALALASDWDKKRFPPAPALVVLETTSPVPPESRVQIELDAQLPSPAGHATPGRSQQYVVQAERALLIDGFECTERCDPELRNAMLLRRPVPMTELGRAIGITNITTPGKDLAVGRARSARPRPRSNDASTRPTVEDAGFDVQPPATTYLVTLDASLRSTDGQTLGYTWIGSVENWHRGAFIGFGDGHGVWESSGGPVLPFYARNFGSVTEWAQLVAPASLMATVQQLQATHFSVAPPVDGAVFKLGLAVDRTTSHGLDLSKVLPKSGTGLVWAAVEEGKPLANARTYRAEPNTPNRKATLVQVTNLGISVKDSPQNTLVFVARLDNGLPVPGARVSIVRVDQSVFWTGTTGADGVAIAPRTPLRDENEWSKFAFLVTAEKEGDLAYVGSNWNEGIEPWMFRAGFNLGESAPILRGTVFTDRGVYRPGEEVHVKAILRFNTANGIVALPDGTVLWVTLRDGVGKTIEERTVTIGKWSNAEWVVKLPQDAGLGTWTIRAMLDRDKPKPASPPGPDRTPQEAFSWSARRLREVEGDFLVAAYRRPDFRVDVKLASDTLMAGAPLKGSIGGRYLFGAPMGGRSVAWTFSRSPIYEAPDAVYRTFERSRWVFVGRTGQDRRETEQLERADTTLSKTGDLVLSLKTPADAGLPFAYSLEGDVEDVSRQHIAGRAQITVHAAPWYIGLRRPSTLFATQKDGVKADVITVAPDGRVVAGVPIELTLSQVQWRSVRQAEGDSFYSWDSQRELIQISQWTITSADQPLPVQAAVPAGGSFVLRAVARDKDGHVSITECLFYVMGEGYTAWQRYDHNRIDLVPERTTYRPGETARVLIQSPWERATALVTTEREGVRTHRQFALTSTQQTIEIPVTEADIPNVYVSVLLVKGRTRMPVAAQAPDVNGTRRGPVIADDTSDPGKPAFRLGYVDLKVENLAKRLSVAVTADQAEYRPASTAQVNVDVKDPLSRGVASEVTLWAVDTGVLSLTGYTPPDIVEAVYMHKALQVLTEDSRERIVSRRVLTPKGETPGGGGGADGGAGTMRRDFRALAFWLGSVVTGADGQARVTVKLPESLTTYRIMAVAGDLQSRFGSGSSEVRINKPVTLKAAFPRFLAVGDRAFFGAVVTSQLKETGTGSVTLRSLDPAVLEVVGSGEQSVTIPAGGSLEVRFDAAGRRVGRARIQVNVRLGTERDAFEDVIPVEVLASPETVAAYGEATSARPVAREAITIPSGVVPGFGGLHVDLSSTAMTGLAEGARYLDEYPYRCIEQRASRALALLLWADLGEAFRLPGIDPASTRTTVQAALSELETFQCGDGGFSYWPGDCRFTSPYLTSYVLHVFRWASTLGYTVDAARQARALTYLERELSESPPQNEGWWPSYTAWQAYAVKTLAEAGRNVDSHVTRLYGYRDRMPVFGLAYLFDALLARRETTGPRVDDLKRRLGNAVLPEAGSAHIEELADPYLLWFWNSNVRSTAIALQSLVKGGDASSPVREMVRWLMAARKNGRWGNTQENAQAMEALVAYYRTFETVTPDFRALVKLGAEDLARQEFKGRSTTAASTDLTMEQVLTKGQPGETRPLTFSREGAGTLFYTTRLRYAADQLHHDGLDSGIRIERTYEPYVESGAPAKASLAYRAGDLVRVTLTLTLTKERRFIAVTDPLPAGFEPIESWFATTARALAAEPNEPAESGDTRDGWFRWWARGGFDHVERHDDRVLAFATRLSEGKHEFTYVVRATTAGTFRTAPAHAEEMYEPEVFGRTATAVVEVKK